ncbi:hypothetical protein ACFSGX_13860 [Sphingomonas arantia]|uniref:Uncharacterized protein n=1 Tax=Sphingomonas arantia TaxID=1460676 RepID=A0ABW4TYP5_9SPHN
MFAFELAAAMVAAASAPRPDAVRSAHDTPSPHTGTDLRGIRPRRPR